MTKSGQNPDFHLNLVRNKPLTLPLAYDGAPRPTSPPLHVSPRALSLQHG